MKFLEYSARILPAGMLSVLAGVLLWYAVDRHSVVLALLVVFTILLVYFAVRTYVYQQSLIWVWGSTLVIACVVAYGFVARFEVQNTPYTVIDTVGSRTVVVVQNPDYRTTATYIVAQELPIRPDTGYIRIRIPRTTRVAYGDIVQVSGTLRTPEPFTTDTGSVFQYDNYLAVDRIYRELTAQTVQVVGYAPPSRLLVWLYQIANQSVKHITDILPEPQAGLIVGITLGNRGGITAVDQDMFRAVGLSHIIVLSGFNIALLANTTQRLLQPVGSRRVTLILSALLCILFMLLTGASPSVVRATSMVLLVLFAQYAGRSYASWRGLLYAVVIMVCFNPRILVDDIGWQLSVCATAGLLFLEPYIRNWIQWIPDRYTLRETVSTTLAATLAVLPLLLFSLRSVAGWGLVVNVLVLWAVPYILYAGLCIAVLGYFSSLFAVVPAGIAYVLTMPIWWVSRLFASITPISLMANILLFTATVCGGLVLSWRYNQRYRSQ